MNKYSHIDPLIDECSELSISSTDIRKNCIYFAIKGSKFNGNDFIPEAFKLGAKYAITDDASIKGESIIYVDNVRSALAYACSKFYQPKAENLLAITGTNGKTSTAYFTFQILNLLGFPAASIGTIGLQLSKEMQDKVHLNNDKNLTSPDIITFHRTLHQLKIHGVNYSVFEASSHGLDQKRTDGVKLKAAAFTNFTREHLDYHKTMEEYLNAKLKIFDLLEKEGVAVINSDMTVFEQVRSYLQANNINYVSIGKNGNLKIANVDFTAQGTLVTFEYAGKSYNFTTKIIGYFQIENLLTSALLVSSLNIPLPDIINKLPLVKTVVGRLEEVETQGLARVFVDYAHSPDALEKALIELRKITPKSSNLWVIFGCGGDRDKGKRPEMGAVASKLADKIIVTDDNPRTEDAAQIRFDVMQGAQNAIEIAGRDKAISYVLENSNAGDILLIAGKGHEDYQIIGSEKLYFSDQEFAKNYKIGNIGIK